MLAFALSKVRPCKNFLIGLLQFVVHSFVMQRKKEIITVSDQEFDQLKKIFKIIILENQKKK